MDGSDDRQDDATASTPGTGPAGRRPGRVAVLVGVLAVVAVGIVGLRLSGAEGRDLLAANPPHADAAVAGTPVTVGTDVCGDGWSGGDAGRQTFALWNNSIQGMEVYLEDDRDREHRVVLDIENLGAGVTRAASAVLEPGRYEFVCLPAEEGPRHGPPQVVRGRHVPGATPGVAPVTRNDLMPAVSAYQRWITGRLPDLQRQAARLDDDVRRGDLAAARADWLRAHLTYETLGAAYGAFGDHDTAIDGLPRSGRTALDDRRLTGFRRIEALLWHGAPAARVAPYTRGLVADVAALRHDFHGEQLVDTLDMGLRSHEILENAIQRELTGTADAGSHTGLATIDANLTGTEEALRPLLPLLRPRDPHLAETRRWLERSRRTVRDHLHHGRWTPLTRLDRTGRERLAATLTQTVELLSQVAVITDPRRGIS